MIPDSREITAYGRLAWDVWALWVDASAVITMRSWKLMAGGFAAGYEVERMVGEKIVAPWELAAKLAASGPMPPREAASRSVRHYRSRVSANRRRLSRTG
ncbi:MAG: hypothetical protein IE933_15020 [Sphingomonadales bacterium]|nr:hypothetical protein [Sphingomonadales bacterium]MBD3773512.1 hypothetical protein [Paracoccaceae bacterium]